MRLMTVGVLAAAVSLAGCNGAETAAAAGAPATAAPAADANRDPGAAPVATGAKAEPERPHARNHDPDGNAFAHRARHLRRIGHEPRRAAGARAPHEPGRRRRADRAGRRLRGQRRRDRRHAVGQVKGRAHVAVRFNSVSPRGEDDRYTIETAAVARTAAATKKKDALKIGAPGGGRRDHRRPDRRQERRAHRDGRRRRRRHCGCALDARQGSALAQGVGADASFDAAADGACREARSSTRAAGLGLRGV